jgi:two-component system cell cycle response regulator
MAVEAEPLVTVEKAELRITTSIGVAQAQEGDSNGGVLLARADVALYRAKSLGRNRVESDVLE